MRPQFSIRTVLVFTTIVALCVGIGNWYWHLHDDEVIYRDGTIIGRIEYHGGDWGWMAICHRKDGWIYGHWADSKVDAKEYILKNGTPDNSGILKNMWLHELPYRLEKEQVGYLVKQDENGRSVSLPLDNTRYNKGQHKVE